LGPGTAPSASYGYALTGTKAGLGAAFWRFLWASAISYTGDGLVLVALPLLAYTLTRNPVLIAGVAATSKVFQAVAAVPGGVLADRTDRRRVMWACNVVSALSLLLLLAAMSAHVMALAVVYLVGALIAASDATYRVSMWGATPDIIAEPAQLAKANAHVMAAQMSGEQFVGQAGGGVLFSLSRRLPFFVDCISFFVSAVLIRSIAPRKLRGLHFRGAPRPQAAPSGARSGGHPTARSSSWAANFLEGFRYFRQDPSMKLLTLYIGVAFFAQYMVFGLVVLYGRDSLRLSPALYGVFLTVAAGLGVVGSLVSGRFHARIGTKVLVVGLCLMSLGYIGMALEHQWVLASIWFGFQDFGVAVVNVGSLTARQQLIPKQLQGRVMGVYRLLTAGSAPFGALLSGVVASLSNVRTAILVAGVIVAVLVVVLGPVLLRVLRQGTEATAAAA
jgi:MFS family permease